MSGMMEFWPRPSGSRSKDPRARGHG